MTGMIANALPGLAARVAGGVKAVYRGVTAGAATVTLPARVDPAKTIVLSNSKGSAGTVAATGSVGFGELTLSPLSSPAFYSSTGAGSPAGFSSMPNYTGSGSGTITGGTTDLVVKVYSAVLNSEGTQIQTDGPVEYQVIEFA